MCDNQNSVRQGDTRLNVSPKILRMLCTGLGIGLIAMVGIAGAGEAAHHYRIPAQALSQLLHGSGMTYRFVDAKTVTIEAPTSNFRKTVATQNKPEPQSNNGETTLPKVMVEADSDNPYDDPTWTTDPRNTDYNRPNATTATKTDTPIMETPVNIQVVPQQVMKDQQTTRIEQALQNTSGVYKQQADAQSFGLLRSSQA